MKKFIDQKNSGRFATTVATLVVALLLVACGGGGSSGSTPTTPINTPVATGSISSTVPNCTVQLDMNKCTTNISWSTSNAKSVSVTDAGGKVLSTTANGTLVVDVLVGTNTYNLIADGKQLGSVTITGVCASGTGAKNTPVIGSGFINMVCTAIVVPPVTVWPATTVYPISQKMMGTNVLSSASKLIGDTAWQEAVKDGTIKIMDSNVVMTGFTNVPLVWAVYRRILENVNGIAGNNQTIWCTVPVRKDNGESFGAWNTPNSNCNTDEQDWFFEDGGGIIRHSVNFGACFQKKWNGIDNFNDPQVPCP